MGEQVGVSVMHDGWAGYICQCSELVYVVYGNAGVGDLVGVMSAGWVLVT